MKLDYDKLPELMALIKNALRYFDFEDWAFDKKGNRVQKRQKSVARFYLKVAHFRTLNSTTKKPSNYVFMVSDDQLKQYIEISLTKTQTVRKVTGRKYLSLTPSDTGDALTEDQIAALILSCYNKLKPKEK